MNDETTVPQSPTPPPTTWTNTRLKRPRNRWLLRGVWLVAMLLNLLVYADGLRWVIDNTHRHFSGTLSRQNADGAYVVIDTTDTAAAAGIQRGDILLSVDGEPFPGPRLDDTQTTAVYRVQTPGQAPRDVTLALANPDYSIYAGMRFGLPESTARIVFLLGEIAIVSVCTIAALLVFALRSDDWLAVYTSWALLTAGLAQSIPFFFAHVPSVTPYAVAHIYGMIVFPLAMLSLLFFPSGAMRPRYAWVLVLLYTIALFVLPLLTASSLLNFGLPNLLIMGYIAGIVFRRYRHEFTPAQRQQTKWMVFGLLGFLASLFVIVIRQTISATESPFELVTRLTFLFRPVEILLALSLPVGFVFSLLRYRLWDVDLVLNRSVVGGLVTLIVGALYTAAFALIHTVMSGLVDSSSAMISLTIAAVISGAAFTPIRRRVRNLVDRHLFGLRYDLNEIRRAQAAREAAPQAARPLDSGAMAVIEAADAPSAARMEKPGPYSGRLLDTWRLLGMIGRGGMGEVYRAIQQPGDRIAAVKVLTSELMAKTEFRTRFDREAQTLQKLDHPNIVKLWGYGESEGIHYLAMEYLPGRELSVVLTDQTVLEPGFALQILSDLAGALDYVHGRGLVHRDIKPGNVILRTDGNGSSPRAVLMDFGIAKIQDANTRYTGDGAMGTVDYMAPEQIMAAREVDHRADIYALGIVAFEMLVGERPFKGGAAQVVFAHVQQPAPDPHTMNPQVSARTAAVLLKALEKQAEDRYTSAGEFARALQLALLQPVS